MPFNPSVVYMTNLCYTIWRQVCNSPFHLMLAVYKKISVLIFKFRFQKYHPNTQLYFLGKEKQLYKIKILSVGFVLNVTQWTKWQNRDIAVLYTDTHSSRTQIYNWSLLSNFNYMACCIMEALISFRLGNLIIRLQLLSCNILFFEIIQVWNVFIEYIWIVFWVWHFTKPQKFIYVIGIIHVIF